MHVGNQMVSGTTLQTNMAATRTVIVEVKYISSKNVVIHSENCKVEHADQTVISVMQPTRLGRTRRLTQRMIDYLQS